MNRIRDVIRKIDKGISFNETEEKKEEKTYEKEYQDANLNKTLEKLRKENKITPEEYDYVLENLIISKDGMKLEERYKKQMLGFVENEEIYCKFLKKIKGIGGVISTQLIRRLGYCERFNTISKLWIYCGVGIKDGAIQKRKKGEEINYNPKLKTLMYLISDSFIKHRTPVYRDIYDTEKNKQLGKIKWKNKKKTEIAKDSEVKSRLHADLRARRKAVKIFLENYWVCAREIKGLEISKPYVFNDKKHTHYISWMDVIR
jgi:hypothetical protein